MFSRKSFTTRNVATLFEWPKWFMDKYDNRPEVWADCALVTCGPALEMLHIDRSDGPASNLPEDIQKAIPWSDTGVQEISLFYLVPGCPKDMCPAQQGGVVRVKITKDDVLYQVPVFWANRSKPKIS